MQHVERVEGIDGPVLLDRPTSHRARQRYGEVGRLFRQQRSLFPRREKDAAGFEEADVGETVGVVVRDGAEQPGKDPGAQDGLLGAQRVGSFDEPVERRAGPFEVGRRHERDGDGF